MQRRLPPRHTRKAYQQIGLQLLTKAPEHSGSRIAIEPIEAPRRGRLQAETVGRPGELRNRHSRRRTERAVLR